MSFTAKRNSILELSELRQAIGRMVGGAWRQPGRLYRIVPPRGLSLWRADGTEEAVVRPEAGQGQPSTGAFSPSDEVIPLELDPGSLWGYWVVAREDATVAQGSAGELLWLLQRLPDAEARAGLEKMNGDLVSVMELGGKLATAEGPAGMVTALHGATRKVLGAEVTHLALLGLEGSRWYRATGDGPVESGRASAKEWLKTFPAARATWDRGGRRASAAHCLLGGEPSAGMVSWLGDPDRPHGIVVIQRGAGEFDGQEQGLFSRMADFVLANLSRWERAGGSGAKRMEMPDLFVLLAQEKERLEYIMRCVPVGLLLTDADGVIALTNDAAGHALGLTDVELREKKMFGSRQAGRTIRGLIEKTQGEGKPVSTPYEMEGRWFQIQVIPWPGGAQFLVVTQDVHDWHQLNRLKEDLISIISHEVKNPLTAVINATHLLASGRPGPLNESQARVAQLIQENSQQIKGMLDDVVRLSRVYHLNSRLEPVALCPVVRAIHDRSAPTLKGKLLSWTESLEEVTVGGDASMVENLLLNLIGNAIKYTGIGGRVGVRLYSEGGLAKLRVMDDGPGIPPDERNQLFTPFFRASNVREQVTGTGLGLVICRNIAERLGGTLQAFSPITAEDAAFLGDVRPAARGAAFQVELPLARQ